MKIVVSNNIRVKDCPVKIRAEITKTLTMENPEFIDRLKKKRPLWGVEKYIKCYSIEINGDLICPRGFLSELHEILKCNNINFDQTDLTVTGDPVDFGIWNEMYNLYPYQANAVLQFSTNNSGVIVAPAGAGKTNIALRCVFETQRPTLWITHTKDLMYQTKERAELLMSGVGKVGIIGDGEKYLGSGKLIIATVQTLQRSPELVETLKQRVGVVVVDEAHHTPTSTFVDIVNQFTAKHLLGVTATPDRKDQLERLMYLALGAKIAEIDRKQLYDDGVLIKPEVNFIYTDFNYKQTGENIDAGGEDLNYHELMSALISDDARAELIAESIFNAYRRYGTSLVLAESVRYCFKLQELVHKLFMQKYGVYGTPEMATVHGGLSKYTWLVAGTETDARRAVNAGQALDLRKKGKSWQIKVEQYTDDELKNWQLTKKQRLETVEKFRSGEIQILFATQLAREGLDIPHLCVGHLATPMRGDVSKDRSDGAAVEQYIGRVMRADKNNSDKRAAWYDYVDYGVGVFKSQYNSRRRVYQRLGIKLPRKKSSTDDLEKLLGDIKF